MLYHIYRIDMNNKRWKRVRWGSSKWLIYGSLLCFSLDRFTDNKMFAVIAERDAKRMEKGKINVVYINELQIHSLLFMHY